jgi:hypothetical protein
MKVQFADSFFESLKKLNRSQRIPYRILDSIRYEIPNFLKNIWVFRKSLYNYRWYDHSGVLNFMADSFGHMSKNLELKGLEIDEGKLKKVAAMKRAETIIRNINESNYIALAENELGDIFMGNHIFDDDLTEQEQEHNSKVFKRSTELEENEWEELIQILKGQDYTKFSKEIDWYKQFDGTGLRGWWD